MGVADDRRARAAAAVDRAFGEAVLFTRWRSAGQMKGPRPDPDRAPLTVQAVWHDPLATLRADKDMPGRHYNVAEVEGAAAAATASLAAFASPAEWPVAPDRLQRLEQDGQPIFEVLKAVPDGAGRLVVILTWTAA